MPELSDAARAALGYWSVIESAAANRLSTAELWSDIRDAAEDMGFDSPGVTVQGVSQLRGVASSIQASGRRFERSGPSFSLDQRMVAEAPWSRPIQERNALGIYQVRYQHTTIGPDGPNTEWRTSVFTGGLPATVQDMRDALDEDAGQLADKYGVSHVGYGNVQILSV